MVFVYCSLASYLTLLKYIRLYDYNRNGLPAEDDIKPTTKKHTGRKWRSWKVNIVERDCPGKFRLIIDFPNASFLWTFSGYCKIYPPRRLVFSNRRIEPHS